MENRQMAAGAEMADRWTPDDDFRKAFEALGSGIVIKDERGRVRFVNGAMVRMAGYDSADDVVGRPVSDLVVVADAPDGGEAFESVVLTRGRDTVPVTVSMNRLENGGAGNGVIVVMGYGDGAEGVQAGAAHGGKRARDRLLHLAYHDHLTGLPNRYLFFDRLDQALYLAERFVHNVAVYFMDLNGFKAVNDTHGHESGDAVLKEAAARIQGCLRRTDTVARLGGDEYAVILPDLDDVREAAAVAAKIVVALERPFHVRGGEASLGVSIGISIYPFHGRRGVTLLRNADKAMYRAKEAGMTAWAVHNPGAVKGGAKRPGRDTECPGAIGAVSERRKTLPLLSSVIDAVPDPAIAFDMAGRVIYVNDGFSDLFALKKDDFIGKHILEVPGMGGIEAGQVESYMKLLRDIVDKGSGGPVRLRFPRWDGKEMHVMASGGVARDGHNNPTHLIATLREAGE